jgi:sulfite dehydrogenase (cytochrome) subunit B
MTMKRFVLPALAAAALSIGVPGSRVIGKPVSYTLPDETAAFKPGPNLEAAQNNCTGCHSADYIQTQPRGAKFKKDFWQAEVTKMIKNYGAPIEDADVGKIVDYLSTTY